MKINLLLRTLVTASVLVALFAITGMGQMVPIVGGYSSIATDHPYVEAAVEFSIATKNKEKGVRYELIEILTAQSQPVAGTNYKVCIEANVSKDEDAEPVPRHFLVVVYKDLKLKLRLTSWLEKECSK